MNTTVGELRAQSAYANGDRPVIATVKAGGDLALLLAGRRIVVTRFYPDTVDADGKPNSTFKVEIELEVH